MKSAKGFTIIELVLYMGILSILLTVLSALFATIINVQLESKSTSGVDQTGRYIIAKLLFDTKSMSEVTLPAFPGEESTALQIQRNSIHYTYSLDSNNNLRIKNDNTGEENVLNSMDTQVTGLNFLRVGSGGNNDTVQVTFTVSSRIMQPKGQESRAFRTTLGRQ